MVITHAIILTSIRQLEDAAFVHALLGMFDSMIFVKQECKRLRTTQLGLLKPCALVHIHCLVSEIQSYLGAYNCNRKSPLQVESVGIVFF